MSDTVFAFDPGEREYWMHMLISNMASARYYHPPIPLYSSLRVTWPVSTPLSFYPYLSIYIYIYVLCKNRIYIYTLSTLIFRFKLHRNLTIRVSVCIEFINVLITWRMEFLVGNGVEWEIVLFDRKEGKFLSSCMVDRESS